MSIIRVARLQAPSFFGNVYTGKNVPGTVQYTRRNANGKETTTHLGNMSATHYHNVLMGFTPIPGKW